MKLALTLLLILGLYFVIRRFTVVEGMSSSRDKKLDEEFQKIKDDIQENSDNIQKIRDELEKVQQ